MDKADVVYSGILKKSPPERRLMRTWHKRFFVLKSNRTLTYYQSEKDCKKAVKEPIDLTGCQSIEANLNHNNKSFKHVFSINTTKRVYYLVADNKQDMDNWVKHLCRVCGFEKQGSPDFVRNRAASKSSPKAIKLPQQQTATLPSPMTPSPQPLCPLSKSMPLLNPTNKPRSISDPPDHEDMMKRAEQQYLASTLERRKSADVTPHFGRPNMTLPVKGPDLHLSQVPENYDPVPPFQTTSQNEVDGGYASLRPGGRTPVDQSKSLLSHPTENYDVVPRPRPVSQDMYDVVPPPRPGSQYTDDDIYDTPPMRGTEQGGNYDVVPPPRPSSQNGQFYDYLPQHNRYSYSHEETYDVLPHRESSHEDDYDIPPNRENYDTVPPPRPQKNFNNSDYYDTLPSPVSSEDLYDFPPNFQNGNTSQMQPPARPPKSSAVTNAKDHYDIVPAPSGRTSRQENSETENRDSGSYPDDIYSVPPTRTVVESDDDIYDIPPKPSDADIYDEFPRRNSVEDYYDTPPALGEQGSVGPPSVNRSIKPPQINRNKKPPDHNYTNLAPPIDRKSKPPQPNRTDNHSYENLRAPGSISRGPLLKSKSLTETETTAMLRNCQQTDYCDMQPFRSEDTRCYSFSRDLKDPSVNYEEMEANPPKRESGVHSNSSSSEDNDTEDCYMTMGPPDKTAHQQRKAALQYCEVQIIEGQAKCQIPAPRREAESHYTTINEESTQAFLQTCRQQETSRN